MIALGSNSAPRASAAVIVVSVRRHSRTRMFHFADRLEKPLMPLLREFDFPDLLSGIDDECIRNANFHLVFDKSAIGESLNHVIGVNSAAGWRPA